MNSDSLRTLSEFLLPPSGFILLLAIGLFFWLIRLRKTAAFCIVLASVLLYFASTPFIARKLMDPLQYQYEVLKEVPEGIQAIVVLSGGRIPIAREYTNLDTVNAASLERLRYASRLSKIYQLPVMLVGGSVNQEHDSEAELMQHVLKTDFGVQATWLEEESKNTFENAKLAKKILKENSISKFLLITHAYHMPRAMWSFEEVGLEPHAAPTVFMKRGATIPELYDYTPSANALKRTRISVREHLAKFWYKYIGT